MSINRIEHICGLWYHDYVQEEAYDCQDPKISQS
jgi:hypothetical protein